MAFNEKVKTADVVEILDVKIKTTSAHPLISVTANERYDDVLESLETQVLSPGEKDALDSTATVPSASNPVVLKNDLPTYHPALDLGEVLDAVATFADLPPQVMVTGDLTIGSTTVSNVSSMVGVIPSQLVAGTGVPALDHILTVGVSSFVMNQAATASGLGVSLTIGPDVGDVRPVLDENVIYRWSGSAWVAFISTGTLDHTQLINQNLVTFSSDNIHMSTAERLLVNTQDHTHANKAILDLITDAGSTQIITIDERNRLPSQGQKDALAGTTGTPNISNRYVTNQDPRLNTLKNPYVSAGNDVAATYSGTDIDILVRAVKGISLFPCIIPIAAPAFISVTHIYKDGDPIFFYPTTISVTGDLSNGLPTISNVSSLAGVAPGLLVVGNGIPDGAIIATVGVTSFDLNIPPAVDLTGVTLTLGPGSLPVPLQEATPYYVRNSSPSGFYVSLTPFGSFVDTTAPGSASHAIGGDNPQVKCIEVLPQNLVMYSLGNTTDKFIWSLQPEGMMLESLTPFGATLSFRTFTDSLQLLPPGVGPVTVRGINFILYGNGTRGFLVERDYCTFENCSFTGNAPLTDNHVALNLMGNYPTVRHCIFKDFLTTAIELSGDSGLIDGCQFNLSVNTSLAVHITGNNAKLLASRLDNCTISIAGSANNTFLNANMLGSTVTVTDNGIGTRFLHYPSNDPKTFGQALIGKRRTIGRLGSMADYRSNDESAFILAMADPYGAEFEVLEGSYLFNNSVTVAPGKKLRGVSQGSVAAPVLITGVVGVNPFILSSDTTLENLEVFSTSAPTVSMTSCDNVVVERCTLNISVPLNATHVGVYGVNCTDIFLKNSFLSGVRGAKFVGGSYLNVYANDINVSGNGIETDAAVASSQIKDNRFIGGTCAISGLDLIVEGNHFLTASIPTKAGTTASVWQNNYPHPQTNNFEGVDYVVLSMSGALQSRSPGVENAIVLDAGCLSFLKTGTAEAITLPMPIGAAVDLTFPFSIVLHWTSLATAGNVQWQVRATFRDEISKQFGTPQVQLATSTRSGALFDENVATLSFPAIYGLPALIQPTHVSVEVVRLPSDPLDTVPIEVYLMASEISLKRT